MISGFTFVHNALEGGYPILEALAAVAPIVDEFVIVDMESTDETVVAIRHIMNKNLRSCRILASDWEPGGAGECLRRAHSRYTECQGDTILHFEADEVYDDTLVSRIAAVLNKNTINNIAVQRIQIEQNFQRVRWYPIPVHRVFPNEPGVYVKYGASTSYHYDNGSLHVLTMGDGLLWDIANCFKDHCIQRFNNQAELWGHEPCYKFVNEHSHHVTDVYTPYTVQQKLYEPHWDWRHTPYKLPRRLEPLVGISSYHDYHARRGYNVGY